MANSSDLWQPTVEAVAGLLRARTVDKVGREMGTFTSDTRPTREQVESLIATATVDIAADTGVLPTGSDDGAVVVRGLAARAAELYAAMLVELTYFPEQVAAGKSPYGEYKSLLEGGPGIKGARSRLVSAANEYSVDQTLDAGDDVGPAYSFPEDCGGLVGWGTRW